MATALCLSMVTAFAQDSVSNEMARHTLTGYWNTIVQKDTSHFKQRSGFPKCLKDSLLLYRQFRYQTFRFNYSKERLLEMDHYDIEIMNIGKVWRQDNYSYCKVKASINETYILNGLKPAEIKSIEDQLNRFYQYNTRIEKWDTMRFINDKYYYSEMNGDTTQLKCSSKEFFLLMKPDGDSIWYALNYNTDNIANYYKAIPRQVFLRAEEISGKECTPVNMPLKDIGAYVFKAIKDNAWQKVYCELGVTDMVAQKDFIKERNATEAYKQNSYFSGLMYRQTTIKEDIIQINNHFGQKLVAYIGSHEQVVEQKGKKFCNVLVEYKMDGEYRYIEIECGLTQMGWKIIDDINQHSHSDINNEVVEKLRQKNKGVEELKQKNKVDEWRSMPAKKK
jgi:hypothetical protein